MRHLRGAGIAVPVIASDAHEHEVGRGPSIEVIGDLPGFSRTAVSIVTDNTGMVRETLGHSGGAVGDVRSIMGDVKFTALPPDGSDKLGSPGSKPGRHWLECVGAEFDTGQEMTGSCTQVAYGDRGGMLHPIMEVGAAYELSPGFTQPSELHASDVAGLRSGVQNGGRLGVSASGAKLALGLA